LPEIKPESRELLFSPELNSALKGQFHQSLQYDDVYPRWHHDGDCPLELAFNVTPLKQMLTSDVSLLCLIIIRLLVALSCGKT